MNTNALYDINNIAHTHATIITDKQDKDNTCNSRKFTLVWN